MSKHLILLHGALGSAQQVTDLKTALSVNFTVHSFDFSGHGSKAAESQVMSMQLFAQNCMDFMRKNNIDKAHFFGYSMGGYVALTLAETSPNCIERLITLGTKFDWNPEQAQQETRMLNPDKIEQKVPAFAKSLATTHGVENWKKVLKKTAVMMQQLGNGSGLSSRALSEISNRALITIGSADTMVSVEESIAAAKLIPNASHMVLEGVEHPIAKLDVPVFAALITDFLKS